MALNTIITLYSDAEHFGVNAGTQMAARVPRQLGDIKRSLDQVTTDEPQQLKLEIQRILDPLLPMLKEEHRLAREANFTKLEPWIGGLISELEQVATCRANRYGRRGPTFARKKLSRLLTALETPAKCPNILQAGSS